MSPAKKEKEIKKEFFHHKISTFFSKITYFFKKSINDFKVIFHKGIGID